MSWLEHTVQIEVAHPVETVWNAWTDLPSMPNWMRWLEAVEIAPHQPSVSIWHMGANGFTFAWQSRITKQVPLQMLQWESVSGLPNRGTARFYGRGQKTTIKLSVAYAIPTVIAQLMDSLFLGRLVENSLSNSLQDFSSYLDSLTSALTTTG